MGKDDLARVMAQMALRGVSRREAARRLYVSPGALNKKLRGDKPLLTPDRLRLSGLGADPKEAPRP